MSPSTRCIVAAMACSVCGSAGERKVGAGDSCVILWKLLLDTLCTWFSIVGAKISVQPYFHGFVFIGWRGGESDCGSVCKNDSPGASGVGVCLCLHHSHRSNQSAWQGRQ